MNWLRILAYVVLNVIVSVSFSLALGGGFGKTLLFSAAVNVGYLYGSIITAYYYKKDRDDAIKAHGETQ